jgi:DNA-binding GntR family transcriptional regulator
MTTHQGLHSHSRQGVQAAINGFGELVDRFSNIGTAAEVAHAVLREAILSNVLSPGTRLRADELAKHLGVSKTPVREALRKLQAEEFIVVSPGNALTVRVLSEKQLLEIYYTREALEGMAARLAAENAGALDLANLRAVLQDLEGAFGASNRDRLRHFIGEFQLAVFKAAHNDFLHDLLKSLQEKIRNQRAMTISLPGRDEEVVTFCRDLLHVIERRNPDACESLARANRRRTLELRLKMMRSAPPSG